MKRISLVACLSTAIAAFWLVYSSNKAPVEAEDSPITNRADGPAARVSNDRLNDLVDRVTANGSMDFDPYFSALTDAELEGFKADFTALVDEREAASDKRPYALRMSAFLSFLRELGRRDGAAGIAFIRSQPEQHGIGYAASEVFSTWVEADFDAASQFVEASFRNPATTPFQMQLEAEAFTLASLESLKREYETWFLGILTSGNATYKALIGTCLSTMVNVSGTAEDCESVSKSIAAAPEDAVLPKTVSDLANTWIRIDPKEAAKWAGTVENHEQFVAASGAVAQELAEHDPVAAVEFLNGPVTDRHLRDGDVGGTDWFSPMARNYIETLAVFHAGNRGVLTTAYQSLAAIPDESQREIARNKISYAYALKYSNAGWDDFVAKATSGDDPDPE